MKPKKNTIVITLVRSLKDGYTTTVETKQEQETQLVLADTDLDDLRDKLDGELDRFFADLKAEKVRQLRERKDEEKSKRADVSKATDEPGF